MDAQNFDNALRALQNAQPFRLFTVELKSGQRFEVDLPGGLIVRDGVAVFIAPGGLPILFDHDSVSHFFPAKADTNLTPE